MAREYKRKVVAEFGARNKAKGVMAGFRKDLELTGGQMRKLAGVALTLAGVGGLGIMIKRELEAIDTTAKWSDRLGIATEHLTGLGYAAKLSGVTVESMRLGLQRMTRRIAEAAQGAGEAKGAIEEMGLSAEALAKAGPHAALLQIADALQNVGTQSDRVRIAFKLFDSEGVALVNMLKGGSAGLAAMEQEADRLGLTFNRIDAAQVEAANDAITRMRSAFEGVARVLVIQLAPHIEAIADHFVTAATQGEGFGNVMLKSIESVTIGIARLGSEIENVIHLLPDMGRAAKTAALQAQIRLTETKLSHMQHGTGFLQYTWPSKEQIQEVRGELVRLNKELAETYDKIAMSDPAAAESRIRAYFDKIAMRRQEIARDISERQASGQLVIGPNDNPEAVLGRPVEGGSAALEALKKKEDTVSEATRGMQSAFERFGDDTLNNLSQVTDAMELLRNLAIDIVGVIARIAIVQPFAEHAAGLLGGVTSGIFHEGGVVGQGGRATVMPAAAFFHAPRLHSGLKSDEFPAILQRGETVIPKGRDQGMNVRILNVLDPSVLSNYLHSPAGTKDILNVLRKNRSAVGAL